MRVRSANTSGWGSWAAPLELTTLPDVPDESGAPATVEVGTVRRGGAVAGWLV